MEKKMINNQKEKTNLETLLNQAKLSIATDALKENKLHRITYAVDEVLKYYESKDTESSWLLKPIFERFKLEAQSGRIDHLAQYLPEYQKIYQEQLEKTNIADIAELSKKVGFDPGDISSIVDTNKTYKEIQLGTQDYKDLQKKRLNAEIDGSKYELTEKEKDIIQRHNEQVGTINIIKNTYEQNYLANSYDIKSAKESLDNLRQKYAPKETKEEKKD